MLNAYLGSYASVWKLLINIVPTPVQKINILQNVSGSKIFDKAS